jgi:hypothetical protein
MCTNHHEQPLEPNNQIRICWKCGCVIPTSVFGSLCQSCDGDNTKEQQLDYNDPLKRWKAHPVKKDEKKYSGNEFLEDVVR